MTKRDLIDEVNKRFPHLSRRDSEVIINAIFDSMVEALAQGDRIEIRGFGSFVVKHRRARQGRNPKSGALVSVAAKRVPFFKVGKELRLRVDGKPYDPNEEGDDSVKQLWAPWRMTYIDQGAKREGLHLLYEI